MHNIIHQLPLENLSIKDNKFNFRCNICSDSVKSKSKRRGWIYQKNGKWFFHCFNCGNTLSFINYLKQYFPEFYFDFFKKSFDKIDKTKIVNEQLKEKIELFKKFPLVSCDKLQDDHKAVKYLISRKIPIDKFSLLYYSSDFTKFSNQLTNNRYENWKFTSERIVIPFYKRNKDIFMFQGRDLKENSSLRYLTVKIDVDYPKIYGLERIDYSKKIVISEGPFDSLFINNSCAFAGSDLCEEYILKFFDKNQIIILMDLEPRNKEINDKVEKFLKNGFTICLLPKSLKKYGKDINDIFLNSSLTLDEINNMIHKNVINGDYGLLKFNMWRIR